MKGIHYLILAIFSVGQVVKSSLKLLVAYVDYLFESVCAVLWGGIAYMANAVVDRIAAYFFFRKMRRVGFNRAFGPASPSGGGYSVLLSQIAAQKAAEGDFALTKCLIGTDALEIRTSPRLHVDKGRVQKLFSEWMNRSDSSNRTGLSTRLGGVSVGGILLLTCVTALLFTQFAVPFHPVQRLKSFFSTTQVNPRTLNVYSDGAGNGAQFPPPPATSEFVAPSFSSALAAAFVAGAVVFPQSRQSQEDDGATELHRATTGPTTPSTATGQKVDNCCTESPARRIASKPTSNDMRLSPLRHAHELEKQKPTLKNPVATIRSSKNECSSRASGACETQASRSQGMVRTLVKAR
jgi:hypothetical protein